MAPQERTRGLHAALLARLDESADIVAGVSTLPVGTGLVARVLGAVIDSRAACSARRAGNRTSILSGSPAPDLREG